MMALVCKCTEFMFPRCQCPRYFHALQIKAFTGQLTHLNLHGCELINDEVCSGKCYALTVRIHGGNLWHVVVTYGMFHGMCFMACSVWW